MRSFMTGSRVYGTPRPDSDVDLVVLVSPEDAAILGDNNQDTRGSAQTLQYGNLNLIALIDDVDGNGRKQFDIWRTVTDSLIKRAPVTKEEAVKAFDEAGRTFSNVRLNY